MGETEELQTSIRYIGKKIEDLTESKKKIDSKIVSLNLLKKEMEKDLSKNKEKVQN